MNKIMIFFLITSALVAFLTYFLSRQRDISNFPPFKGVIGVHITVSDTLILAKNNKPGPSQAYFISENQHLSTHADHITTLSPEMVIRFNKAILRKSSLTGQHQCVLIGTCMAGHKKYLAEYTWGIYHRPKGQSKSYWTFPKSFWQACVDSQQYKI